MKVFGRPVNRPTVIAAGAVVLVLVAVVAFPPVTRNVLFRDITCLQCHQNAEFAPNHSPLGNAGRPVTLLHPATPEGGATQCVQCHLPPGLVESLYAYTHTFLNTDLFGHWRDYEKIRSGKYLPPLTRQAYRVQDRLLEYDSSPCRTCHIESEIKLTTKRGKKAHKNALKNKETCSFCHDNLVHRPIPLRADAN